MDLTMAIAIIGCVIGILSFAFGRSDKNGTGQYKMGQIDAKLEAISKQIESLSQKLDRYDQEIDEKIGKAIESHVREYHLPHN